ncbi:rubrerythrin family protein [Clostridium sp.]|uniref:rubrerythrin family protein n=1 Tax=Clostridium sp. TaxID=1506 RepID=UPI002630EE12|nr:rubrerythrin family protein [Clostridium sp.]
MDLKGSKTEKNLYRTLMGESKARTLYTLFAEKARDDGYQWVGEVFDKTSGNELAHARKVYTSFLNLLGDTKENLKEAINGETNEYEALYKNFEDVAREEGFIDVENFYKELREVEEAHSDRYKDLYNRIETDTMFKGDENSLWVCMNCGYIHEGNQAPLICPLCSYPRAYFKPYCVLKEAEGGSK